MKSCTRMTFPWFARPWRRIRLTRAWTVSCSITVIFTGRMTSWVLPTDGMRTRSGWSGAAFHQVVPRCPRVQGPQQRAAARGADQCLDSSLRMGEATKVMQEKRIQFNKLWHDDAWVDQHIVGPESFEYESHIRSLSRFEGTHPAVMAPSSCPHELAIFIRSCVQHVDVERAIEIDPQARRNQSQLRQLSPFEALRSILKGSVTWGCMQPTEMKHICPWPN